MLYLQKDFLGALKTGIENAINLGKSVLGLFTGKFENISQAQNAIKKGGLLDTISELLDKGLDKIKSLGKINDSTFLLIKKGKDTILNTINNNIENSFTSQLKSIENIDKYISNWNVYYNNKDFTNMDKQYKKIKKELANIMPIENIIIKSRQLENIHNLIKNNGNNFNLTR